MINRLRSRFSRPVDRKRAAVIVAHPDDETLWAGGTILANPDWEWFILSLCRSGDEDRRPRFWNALNALDALGNIANLDDEPEQVSLPKGVAEHTIQRFLPNIHYDVVYTHGPQGEYTRHLRHEEVSAAVTDLWFNNRILATSLMMFSYEDGDRSYLPRARTDAHVRERLAHDLWREKHRIITRIYNFTPDSWEARTTPREEAFWQFDSPESLRIWLQAEGVAS
jgi:LmbE family N-acetylglucosaminyl deacetylase